MPIVDNAIYVEGRRAIRPESLDHAFERLRERCAPGSGFCWIGLLRPSEAEIHSVADEPDLAEMRRRLEGDPELLGFGPFAVLYAVLDKVVDDYIPVLEGLRDDLDGIEIQVLDGDPRASRRIYSSIAR